MEETFITKNTEARSLNLEDENLKNFRLFKKSGMLFQKV